jgi:hypothetical protein
MQVSEPDRTILKKSLDNRIKDKTTSIKIWIKDNEALIPRMVREHRHRTQQGAADMLCSICAANWHLVVDYNRQWRRQQRPPLHDIAIQACAVDEAQQQQLQTWAPSPP